MSVFIENPDSKFAYFLHDVGKWCIVAERYKF